MANSKANHSNSKDKFTKNMNKLQDRLVQSRKTARYSQEKLAKGLGFSKQSIIEWEKGRVEPKKTVIENWAKITNTDLVWLLTGGETFTVTGKEPPNSPTGSLTDTGQIPHNPDTRKQGENEPEAISAGLEEKLRDKEEIIGLLKEKIQDLKSRLSKWEDEDGNPLEGKKPGKRSGAEGA